MPTPPAISATRGRRRAAAVNAPCGPSKITRVPGGIALSPKSPTCLTVIRSRRPSGAAESEYGCDCHQCSRVRKRHEKNWPARAFSCSSRAPPISSETTPGASSITRSTRSRWRALRQRGHPEPEQHDGGERRDVQALPVGAGGRVADELAPGGDLVAEGERDRQVRVEVDEVPRLVAQPPPHDHERAHHHRDQDHEPGDRRDDAGIAAQQPPDLLRQRDAVAERVAGRDRRGVHDQQRQRDLPVPAVPDRQAVEADGPVEHRDAGEQQHLDEHEVGAEQAAQPPQAGQRARRVLDLAEPAGAPPQAHDDRAVGEREQRRRPAGDQSHRPEGARSAGRLSSQSGRPPQSFSNAQRAPTVQACTRFVSRDGSSSPFARDRVELRRMAEPVERGEHAGADALGPLLVAGRAQPAPAEPRVERPDAAAVVGLRVERPGSRPRACAAPRRSGRRARTGARPRPRRSAGESAPDHSSQPSCEPGPGTGEVVALERHHAGPEVALEPARAAPRRGGSRPPRPRARSSARSAA